ncbi:MAG: cob(I)yrinic acid a,c-diamide adenosyltransferase [Anaerolineaceae bacterium]|nr:cob(I)yrinic acid a,c-diamide adenosyltransferase [Anaerolineaceae bacterium]
MAEFFTRKGDDGYTGLLGKGRYPKEGGQLEALGAVDEITSVLGFARSLCKAPGVDVVLLEVQRHLYILMSELAATQENAAKFSAISDEHVEWLEAQLTKVQELIEIPKEFILPGDTISGAALDMARTVTRRAERRVAALFHAGQVSQHVLRYLNRLSSLCYILELREYQFGGNEHPTLAHSPR